MSLADSIRTIAADPRGITPAQIADIAAEVERLERFADEIFANACRDAHGVMAMRAGIAA